MKLIIFDLDGVLVDTESLHTDAFIDASLQVVGSSNIATIMQVPHDGRTTKDKLRFLKEQLDLHDAELEKIDHLKQKIVTDKINKNIIPDYKQQEMLAILSERYNLAIASNSREENVIYILNLLGIVDYFKEITSGDKILLPKPHPDIFLNTMEKFNVLPKETLILEDSPKGLTAAYESGANVLVVNSVEQVTLEFIEDAISGLRH